MIDQNVCAIAVKHNCLPDGFKIADEAKFYLSIGVENYKFERYFNTTKNTEANYEFSFVVNEVDAFEINQFAIKKDVAVKVLYSNGYACYMIPSSIYVEKCKESCDWIITVKAGSNIQFIVGEEGYVWTELKTQDLVRTPKGSFAIVRSGGRSVSVTYIDKNKHREKVAWWNANDLELIGNIADTMNKILQG